MQETRDPRADEPETRDEAVKAVPPDDEEGAVHETAEPVSEVENQETPAAPAEVDFKDRWLRAEAELQNFRRRARREMDEARRAAEEAVLLDLVALLDDLERALAAAGESGAPGKWSEGVALVLHKGRDYLQRQGVQAVDPVGEAFDPRFHEAILEIEAPEGVPPGTVTQVVHKGYRRGERSLRAARVVVAGREAEGA